MLALPLGLVLLALTLVEASSYQETTAVLGRTAVLSCKMDFVGTAQVTWYSPDSRQLTPAGNPRVSITTPYPGESELQIGNIRTDDAGNYSCYININPPIRKFINLIVTYPPIIDKVSPEVTVQSGASVTIDCTASGSPRPSISWNRRSQNDGDTPWTTNVVTKPVDGDTVTSSLTVVGITWQEAGMYVCGADNGVPQAAEGAVTIHVQFAPLLQQSQVLVGQTIGQDATLQCIVVANPQPAVTWSFNDQSLPILSSKYVTSTGPWYSSIYARSFSLIVDSVTSSDFGAYKCTVSNALGQTELLIKLVDAAKVGGTTGDDGGVVSASTLGLIVSLTVVLTLMLAVAVAALIVCHYKHRPPVNDTTTSSRSSSENEAQCCSDRPRVSKWSATRGSQGQGQYQKKMSGGDVVRPWGSKQQGQGAMPHLDDGVAAETAPLRPPLDSSTLSSDSVVHS